MNLTLEESLEVLVMRYHESYTQYWSITERVYTILESTVDLFLLKRVEANNTPAKLFMTSYSEKEKTIENRSSIIFYNTKGYFPHEKE